MKTKQLLFSAIAFIALGNTSCKKDNIELSLNEDSVQFTSAIQGQISTRVTGNNWDANDAIGVFAKANSAFTSSNVQYATTGNGNFKAAGTAINYPSDGSNIDFVAYYPYQSAITANMLPINVADQSNQSAIDVLYAATSTGYNKTSSTAPLLSFAHKLTKVIINVTAGAGLTDLNGLTVAYKGINSVSSLDLTNGAIGAVSTPSDINARVNAVNATTATVEAILIPDNYSNKEVVFAVAGNTYTWTLPASAMYEGGKKNIYNVTLKENIVEVSVEETDGTIVDWNEGVTENTDIDKDTPTEPENPTNPTIVELLNEDFATLSAGGNTTSTGVNAPSGTEITTNVGGTNFSIGLKAYAAGGMVKLGTSSLAGSITSKSLNLSANNGAFTVKFDVKGWVTATATNAGSIDIILKDALGETIKTETIEYSAGANLTDMQTKIVSMTGGVANATITLATKTGSVRCFLDNILITTP